MGYIANKEWKSGRRYYAVYKKPNGKWKWEVAGRAQPEYAKKVDDKTREKLGEAGTVDKVKAVAVWLEMQVSKDKAQGRR